jgi:hypothetical protein
MDTTDERTLDRQIAERLGWRVVHHKDTDTYALVTAENYLFVANALKGHKLYAHNKFIDLVPLGERKTEAEAWNDCPLYSTDLNAAMTLFIQLPGNNIKYHEGFNKPWEVAYDSPGTRYYDGVTLPEAIIEAWLTWKQQPGGG